MRVVLSWLALIAMLASPVFAHPGPVAHVHSVADGIVHPLTGADHILVMVSVGLWGATVGGRAIWIWPVTFLTFMLVGFVAARLGLQTSFAESGVSASMAVLGVLAVAGVRAPLVLGTAITGLFAFFHGYVHGTDATTACVIPYAIGFALSTAGLHGAGIALGIYLRQLVARAAVSLSPRMRSAVGCDGALR